ncbi:MAG: phage holin family protein [Buchananella hordeovulneris]|nr:phage holin family protein [Buchananella hordeovulneris]
MSSTENQQPSVGELLGRISLSISSLIRGEIDLAKAKAALIGKRYGMAVGLFAAAGMLSLFMLPFVLWTFVYVLAIWLPMWAAVLIVTGVLFLAVGLLAVLGLRSLKAAQKVQITPAEGLGVSVQAVTTGVAQGHAKAAAAEEAAEAGRAVRAQYAALGTATANSAKSAPSEGEGK